VILEIASQFTTCPSSSSELIFVLHLVDAIRALAVIDVIVSGDLGLYHMLFVIGLRVGKSVLIARVVVSKYETGADVVARCTILIFPCFLVKGSTWL
jgi:hypothetical protein